MRGKLIVFEGTEGAGKTTQMQQTHNWLSRPEKRETSKGAGEQGRTGDTNAHEPVSPLHSFARVIMTREPGGTALGKELRQLLLAGGEASKEEETQGGRGARVQGRTNASELASLQFPSSPFPQHRPPHDRTELLLYAADRAQHVEEVLKPHLEQGAIILCDRYTDSTVAYQGYGRGINLNFIDQLNQIATGGLESDLTLWLDVDVEMGQARQGQRGTSDRIEQSDFAFHQRVQQGFAELAAAHPQRIVRVDANPGETEVQQQIQSILRKWLF